MKEVHGKDGRKEVRFRLIHKLRTHSIPNFNTIPSIQIPTPPYRSHYAMATSATMAIGLPIPLKSFSQSSSSLFLPCTTKNIFLTPSSQRQVTCSASKATATNENGMAGAATALALAAVIATSGSVEPAKADISGLTPCRESKQFAKREKQSVKKLENALKNYDPESAPALALKATIEKTKRRFDNYGKQGLLCGTDGLPHLIVNGDQAHWGEFITPGIFFLYIAGWIGWVGRSYLVAVRGDKKPRQKEIIIDVPLATSLLWKGFTWPLAAVNEFRSGDLVEKEENITVSPR